MHRAQVRSLAISDDGKWIADGDEDGSLVVRDRTTGRAQRLRGHAGRIRHVVFSHDDRTLLSSDSDGAVRRGSSRRSPSSTRIPNPSITSRDPSTARRSRQSTRPVTSRYGTRRPGHRRVGHAPGRTVALAIAGGTVVTGTTEGVVTWWTDPPVARKIDGTVKALAIGNHHVAVATSKGPIAMFSLEGAPEPVLAGHANGTETVAFDPTGTLLASGGQDDAVRVADGARPTRGLSRRTDRPDRGHDVRRVLARRRLLVSGGNDGIVYVARDEGAVDAGARVIVALTPARSPRSRSLAVRSPPPVATAIFRSKVSAGTVGPAETTT